MEEDPSTLGDIADWQAEWKWDGIRSQLIRRGGRTYMWTRGEELVTDRYPELLALGDTLPEGTVIDGEILPWKDGVVLPFAQLQKRIGRKTIGKKLRDFERAGGRFDWVDDPNEVVDLLPEVFRLHGARRAAMAKPTSFGVGAASRAFHVRRFRATRGGRE